MAVRKTPSKGGKPDKLWRDALMRAVNRAAEKGKKTKRLDQLADVCVAEGLKGNMPAITEIGNRLDGRPIATVAGDQDQPHKLIVEIIDPTRPKK